MRQIGEQGVAVADVAAQQPVEPGEIHHLIIVFMPGMFRAAAFAVARFVTIVMMGVFTRHCGS